MTLAIAWTPFIDPLPWQGLWYLLLPPLAFLIAVAYKAVRVRDLETYWAEVGVFTVKVVVGIVALAVAAHVFVRVVLPVIAPG